jgi:hypothetical protein
MSDIRDSKAKSLKKKGDQCDESEIIKYGGGCSIDLTTALSQGSKQDER